MPEDRVELPRRRVTATLSSGRKIVLAEPDGQHEFYAMRDADALASADDGQAAQRTAMLWSTIKRAVVSIDGAPFEQSSTDVLGFRKMFTAEEFSQLVEMFQRLAEVDRDADEKFRASIRVGIDA